MSPLFSTSTVAALVAALIAEHRRETDEQRRAATHGALTAYAKRLRRFYGLAPSTGAR